MNRVRGEAFAGEGYGSLRHRLFVAANDHIKRSIAQGFYCEAISVTESVISDRLESRLSFLTNKNFGFSTLGSLLKELGKCESDTELLALLSDLDNWRTARNGALHELCKVEANKSLKEWDERMGELAASSIRGYDLLKRVYHRVADLNPKHTDRAFPRP